MALFSQKRPTLDGYEQAELDRLKAIVDRHVKDYATVGTALREIRDRKLYRATHDTFEDFAQQHWQMEKSHAYRLIAAADVARNLSPTGDVPKTERVARPLTELQPDDQRKAWSAAKDLAGAETPTAAIVATAAATIKPRRKKKRHPKPIRIRVPAGIIVIHPGKSFSSVLDALNQATEKIAQRREAA